jgi:hypothetical protein
MVHVLPENEFVELRTNRNLYRITPDEFNILKNKKIGVVGLSVGQSVAVTMALERIFGELYIADFDTIELSNLNRIRTSIHNLGLPKTELVAREIAEIDPYLKVYCYHEGIDQTNIEDFIIQNKLDLLVDECDTLSIKLMIRKIAQKHAIPVLMDTSDRGMIDIERFDIQVGMPIFHGLLENINLDIEHLTPSQRLPILAKIVGVNQISARLKASVLEMEQSICSWPQLASAVALGGAITTDIARRILLNEPVLSGRYYFDITEKILVKNEVLNYQSLYKERLENSMKSMGDGLEINYSNDNLLEKNIGFDKLIHWIEKANLAPSSGNNQPWKWIVKDDLLELQIQQANTKAFGDFDQIPTMISLGAAIENLALIAEKNELELELINSQFDDFEKTILKFNFKKHEHQQLIYKKIDAASIDKRFTDRANYELRNIDDDILLEMGQMVKDFGYGASLQIISDREKINQLANIVGHMDRLRLLNPNAHKDFFTNELRWTTEDALLSGDGIELEALSLSAADIVGLKLLSDPNTAHILNQIEGGQKLLDASQQLFYNTPHILFITLPTHNHASFLAGGQLMQRLWLYLVQNGISAHPVVSPLYFFYRVLHGNNIGLSHSEIEAVHTYRKAFEKIFDTSSSTCEVIMMRIGYSNHKRNAIVRKKLQSCTINQ